MKKVVYVSRQDKMEQIEYLLVNEKVVTAMFSKYLF